MGERHDRADFILLSFPQVMLRAKPLFNLLSQAQVDNIRTALYILFNRSILTVDGRLISFHGGKASNAKVLFPQ
jgi:hypothetical protein